MILASGNCPGNNADGFDSVKLATPLSQEGVPSPLSVRPKVIIKLPFDPVIMVNTPTGLGSVVYVEVG